MLDPNAWKLDSSLRPQDGPRVNQFLLSDSLRLLIQTDAGGHRLSIWRDSEELGYCLIPDLGRLLKRPGTVVAASPFEFRNEQRSIVVRFQGRVLGSVAKHYIVAAL